MRPSNCGQIVPPPARHAWVNRNSPITTQVEHNEHKWGCRYYTNRTNVAEVTYTSPAMPGKGSFAVNTMSRRMRIQTAERHSKASNKLGRSACYWTALLIKTTFAAMMALPYKNMTSKRTRFNYGKKVDRPGGSGDLIRLAWNQSTVRGVYKPK